MDLIIGLVILNIVGYVIAKCITVYFPLYDEVEG